MNLDRVTPGNSIPGEINVIIEIPAHSHPVDVPVITPIPLITGPDAKVLAVPIDKLATDYRHIQTMQDLPQQLLEQIAHVFDHDKDLEASKWVTFGGWEDREAACREIISSIERSS